MSAHGRAPEVDVDRGGGGHVGSVAVDRERPRIEDGEVRLAKLGELLLGRADQHVVHEQRMVGARAHHTHLDAGLQSSTRPSSAHTTDDVIVQVFPTRYWRHPSTEDGTSRIAPPEILRNSFVCGVKTRKLV